MFEAIVDRSMVSCKANFVNGIGLFVEDEISPVVVGLIDTDDVFFWESFVTSWESNGISTTFSIQILNMYINYIVGPAKNPLTVAK